MAHPTRFWVGIPVAVFAGAMLVGPAPRGQATSLALASVPAQFAEHDYFFEPPDPGPTMPRPEIDEPPLDGPSLPPATHRHRHRSTVHPGHI
jgi:hypothetical protein